MSQLPLELKEFIIDSIKANLELGAKFKIILFGSYAHHLKNNRSDIDIAIRCQKPLLLAAWVKIEEIFENSDIPQKIDVLDYHRVNLDFQKVIDQTGVIIFSQ